MRRPWARKNFRQMERERQRKWDLKRRLGVGVGGKRKTGCMYLQASEDLLHTNLQRAPHPNYEEIQAQRRRRPVIKKIGCLGTSRRGGRGWFGHPRGGLGFRG